MSALAGSVGDRVHVLNRVEDFVCGRLVWLWANRGWGGEGKGGGMGGGVRISTMMGLMFD